MLAPCTAQSYVYVPAVLKVNEYEPLVMIALLVKLGEPCDLTLWLVDPPHVHVTDPPTAIVSTAGLELALRELLKKLSPTSTAAVVGTEAGAAWNVPGEPVSPALVAVMVMGPTSSPSVTLVWARPPASVTELVGCTLAAPLTTCHATVTPCTSFPNASPTFTFSGSGRAELGALDWLSPDAMDSCVVGPAVAQRRRERRADRATLVVAIRAGRLLDGGPRHVGGAPVGSAAP